MPVLTVRVANCFIIGENVTHRPDGSWSRNRLTFRLSRFRIELTQNQVGMGRIASSYRGDCVHTTNILVQEVTRKSRKAAEQVVDDLCVLLSFATMSQVNPFSYQLDAEGHSYPPKGVAMHFRPTFASSDAPTIRAFVEQTWPRFRKLKRSRKLPVVIEYMTTAEAPGQLHEVRLLLLFVALENLKSTYARAAGIPFVEGFFRKISSPPKANLSKERIYKFEELVPKMLSDVNMTPRLQPLVKLRNEIIYFGLSHLPYSSQTYYHDRFHDLLREYILRLLGYRGQYLIYSQAARKSASIS